MFRKIVFASDRAASTISSAVRRGELIQVTRGVYSTETSRDPAAIVHSQWPTIVGHLFPGAVITDRSARTAGPVDGVLYLAHGRAPRNATLPGLIVRARSGSGSLPSDIPYPEGLFFASLARGLAENCLPSRARSGSRRTFDPDELGDWIDELCRQHGTEKVMQLRREAEALAPDLGVAQDSLTVMRDAVGVAVGTRDAEATDSEVLKSRRRGLALDQSRVDRFRLLADALRSAHGTSCHEPSTPGQPGRTRFLTFFEAYFSNFIEGTEFEVDEAADIVFNNVIPHDRPQDAHDVLGTYRLVVDPDEMHRRGNDADEFVELLRARHAGIMGGRPDKNPGEFKHRNNRAGSTHFVDHQLVEGTLLAGIALRDDLDTAWERAVYTAFVVAEVHPFIDGNGRAARVAMNAELAAASESRIIVPIVFRQDYLDGLRRLSRQDDPSVFIKAMRYAQAFTYSVDFDDYEESKRLLEQAHAFDEPDSQNRLQILERRRPWDAAPS